MTAELISDGTMPCPVPNPRNGDPCTKTIPAGWAAGEGHGGGHFWADAATVAMLDGGHYDAVAAISGQPFASHEPEDCSPSCARWSEAGRVAVQSERPNGSAR